MASFASTIGAVLACVVSRFIFRDYVQRRYEVRLKSINENMEREGVFYLFALRLIPYIPFVVINLVFGLTKIRFWTYAWVSWVGMIPGTLIYVNAGTQLSQLEQPGDILSVELLLSLLILGVFPLFAKKIINMIRRSRGAPNSSL